MALPSDQPNFVLIPFMAPGHIIPMIDMAKLLAKCGITVTIMVTPLDATRFSSVIDRAVGSGLSIQLLQIRFPCQEAGLPPGCESADSLPTYDLMHNFFVAINMLQKPVEEILKGLKPSPGCIVCDKHIPWTAETCNKFQIPRIIFDGMSCFTQLVTHNLYISKIHETVPASVPFVVPGLPDKIEFTRLQLPGLFNPGSRDFTDLREQVRKTESQAYGWCNDSLDRAQRGNQASIDSDQCLKWLDNRKPGSVIYACLGSLSRLSPAQFIELALGLEESGHPFILVVKVGSKSEEIEEWILDDGIEFLNEKLVVQILETGVRVGAQAVIHLGEEEKTEMMVMRGGIKEAILRLMDEGQEACERRKRAQKLGEMAKRSIQEGGSSSLNIKLLVQDIEQLMKNKTITLNYYTGLAEETFEERVEGRGLIIRGWAPQVLTLSNRSVGGFLTNCGWNSTLEGICACVLMTTWPMFAEQFYIEKFIVYVLKIGVRIRVEVGARPGAVEERSNTLVKWDQVKKSIENSMDDDEEEGRE
ncbi:UNVERIFIED_CONTAM: UDP-glycosyltransferase 73E1 [Sesamum calycinum]|uniref:UDP-glycosyltransferase 73E1 n=1 Tax=Sesamum calycinum TaxID=2727403 RepID=A0AAW2N0E4_9LAMI